MLFEMCALRYAFEASNFVSLFYKIVKVEHGVRINNKQLWLTDLGIGLLPVS